MTDYNFQERPAYARKLLEQRQRKGLSLSALSALTEGGMDKGHICGIEGGKIIPTREKTLRLAKALEFDACQIDELLDDVHAEFDARFPADAARERNWLKFQLIESSCQDQRLCDQGDSISERSWDLFREEFERALARRNASKEPVTRAQVIYGLERELSEAYCGILKKAEGRRKSFHSPEELARALIQSVNLTLEEIAKRMPMQESHLHTMLNPKGRPTPTYAPSWARLADVLLMEELGIKQGFMQAVRQLRREQLHYEPRALKDVLSALPDNERSQIMPIIKALAADRIGDGWYSGMAEIAREAKVPLSVLKNRKHAPSEDGTLEAILKVLEIPADEQQQLLELAAAERAQGAPWNRRGNSYQTGVVHPRRAGGNGRA